MIRNRLATEALADGFEELMWIDADIAFDPRSVDRLRSHNLPIVCERDGVLVATGHGRNGVLLAPLTADRVVAELERVIA